MDRECEFIKLIALFSRLNAVISHRHNTTYDEATKVADANFIQENQISEVAIAVAEDVYSSVVRAREDAPEFFLRRK